MDYNGFMTKEKGKQIGLRLKPEEILRLNQIVDRINLNSDTNMSNVLREFLGLKPRKVTTERDLLYFSGRIDTLPESDNLPRPATRPKVRAGHE